VKGVHSRHRPVARHSAQRRTVGKIEVLSGHPFLLDAAHGAVRQWRYQPTLLNGEPVEVDTTIDVVFALDRNAEP
jgi:hypothetical protein